MKALKKLHQIYTNPISGNIKWSDIEALFIELGAEIEKREGSRIAVVLLIKLKYFTAPLIQIPTRELIFMQIMLQI